MNFYNAMGSYANSLAEEQRKYNNIWNDQLEAMRYAFKSKENEQMEIAGNKVSFKYETPMKYEGQTVWMCTSDRVKKGDRIIRMDGSSSIVGKDNGLSWMGWCLIVEKPKTRKYWRADTVGTWEEAGDTPSMGARLKYCRYWNGELNHHHKVDDKTRELERFDWIKFTEHEEEINS